MKKIPSPKASRIDPEMTVLDVVSRYRGTESVFKKYEHLTGGCICCEALFDSIRMVSKKYGLELEVLLADLESAIGS
jgi:G3E family GTPase